MLAAVAPCLLFNGCETVAPVSGPTAGPPSNPAYEDQVDIVQISGPRSSAPAPAPPSTPPTGSTPGRSVVAPPAPARPQPSPAAPPEPAPSSRSHVVRQGDTLYSISNSYGVSVGDIMNTNGLPNTIIRPGQRLVIPSR